VGSGVSATVNRTSLANIIFEMLLSAAAETLLVHPGIGDLRVHMAHMYRWGIASMSDY